MKQDEKTKKVHFRLSVDQMLEMCILDLVSKAEGVSYLKSYERYVAPDSHRSENRRSSLAM